MGFRTITHQEELIRKCNSGLSQEPCNNRISLLLDLMKPEDVISPDDQLLWFQDFIQFIRQMTTTDEIKLMTFQCDCYESQLLLWHLEMPRFTQIIEEQETQQQQSLTETEGDLLT